MTRRTSRSKGALLGAGLIIAVAGAASPAMAGHGSRERPRGPEARHAHSHDAGQLQIGKRVFEIDARRPLMSIVEAFKCAGYSACIEKGRVIVRTGRRSPPLGWTSDLYDAKFVLENGCISISLSEALCACSRVEQAGGRRGRHGPYGLSGRVITKWPTFEWNSGAIVCQTPIVQRPARRPFVRAAVSLRRD